LNRRVIEYGGGDPPLGEYCCTYFLLLISVKVYHPFRFKVYHPFRWKYPPYFGTNYSTRQSQYLHENICM